MVWSLPIPLLLVLLGPVPFEAFASDDLEDLEDARIHWEAKDAEDPKPVHMEFTMEERDEVEWMEPVRRCRRTSRRIRAVGPFRFPPRLPLRGKHVHPGGARSEVGVDS